MLSPRCRAFRPRPYACAFFYLVVHALRSVTHGQAVVGQQFHSCWGPSSRRRPASHPQQETAPRSVGQPGYPALQRTVSSHGGRGDIMRWCAVVSQQRKAGTHLHSRRYRNTPAGDPPPIDPVVGLCRGVALTTPSGLLSMMLTYFRFASGYTVQRHGSGVLVQLGVRLAADCAVNHHARPSASRPLRLSLRVMPVRSARYLSSPHHASCSWVMAATPRVTLIEIGGEHSICVPMRPPETSIVSWAGSSRQTR